MIIFLIIWTMFSFVFLVNYAGSQKCYENSDMFNLWVLAICFPAFFIAMTFIMLGEYIEKSKERKDINE